jgi:hypothetical protein
MAWTPLNGGIIIANLNGIVLPSTRLISFGFTFFIAALVTRQFLVS